MQKKKLIRKMEEKQARNLWKKMTKNSRKLKKENREKQKKKKPNKLTRKLPKNRKNGKKLNLMGKKHSFFAVTKNNKFAGLGLIRHCVSKFGYCGSYVFLYFFFQK